MWGQRLSTAWTCIAPGEERQGVSRDVDGQAACGLDVCQAANANEVSAGAVFLGHDRFSVIRPGT